MRAVTYWLPNTYIRPSNSI